MTLKCVANFNGKLACGLKNGRGFGLIFMQVWKKKVWKCALWSDPFVQRIQRFRCKSTKELCLMTLKSNAKFEKKIDSWFQKWHEEFGRFYAISGKSENLHFDVLLLSVAYKILAKKVQKNYLSWHWKKIQALKKNWLVIWKMMWGIWWTLTWAVESLKVCTLMGYFCGKNVIFELKDTEELCCEKWLMVSKMA